MPRLSTRIPALISAFLLLAPLAAPQAPQPTRPAITGVAFARFYTTDPAAAQHFYGDTLGFEQHVLAGEWVYAVNSLQWIEIVSQTPPKPNVRMAAVGFTSRDAPALARYLESHGVPIEQPLRAGEFGVRDPEGNLVIFVQSGAGPLRGDSGKPVTTTSQPASRRLIHVGFLVQDHVREDQFWQGLLGFRPYWHGGAKADTDLDYMSLQVPDGSDWLEYMLNRSPDSSLQEYGGMDHVSLGVASMDTAVKTLAANHCDGPNCTRTKLGRDGKMQLNLFDPDFTRVEFMEFTPRREPCCSPFLGRHPTETEDR